MASYNKVILLGNLTRDPELRYLPNSQTAVVDFGLATNRKRRSQDGSQRPDEVCFVDCTMFGKPAETINKYLKKGNPIFIEGRLTFDSWQAQDGTKRSKLKVTIENFQFLGSGQKSGGEGGQENYGGQQQGYTQQAPVNQQPDMDGGQQAPVNQQPNMGGGPDPGNGGGGPVDDIPF